MTLHCGQTAPLFDAKSDDGRRLSLLEMRGQWVVLYFFPRVLTPACSVEAQHFEALHRDFQRLNAQIIGVSSDTEAKQALFRETCQLSFALLPDSQRQVCKVYGVLSGLSGWRGLSQRVTFLIDPLGVVAQVWRNVKPNKHAAEVLQALEAQQSKK